MVIPSVHMMAKQRRLPPPCSARAYRDASQGAYRARGSFVHGLYALMACMNTLIPDIEFDSGPRTDGMESWPSREFVAPA